MRLPGQSYRAAAFGLTLALLVGCSRGERTDLRPLDETGMTFSSLQTLRELNVSNAEVAELVKLRHAGVSDRTAIELVRIARSRQQEFVSGAAVAALVRVGMSEDAVLELARLDRLGLEIGEMQAMRLAGIPDTVILAQARRRAQGAPVLSGPALATMRNAGISDHALLVLVERGVPDSAAEEILRLRRRGAREAEILRRF
jgi:hypothetical protein